MTLFKYVQYINDKIGLIDVDENASEKMLIKMKLVYYRNIIT